jgi:hypothetical protein
MVKIKYCCKRPNETHPKYRAIAQSSSLREGLSSDNDAKIKMNETRQVF